VLAPKPYDLQVLPEHDSAPQWVTMVFPNMIPKGQPGGYVTVVNSYPFGADNLGRDILSRVLYGTRISLAMAFVGPAVSIMVGMLVGLAAGYFGGMIDNLLMRLVDIMYAFPTLLLIILLMTFFRTSFASPDPGSFSEAIGKLDNATGGMLLIFVGIGLTSWMQMARLVRGQVLAVREKEFVLAANALGASTRKIVFQHILPNILGPLIVAETLSIPQYISYEAFLSFIGLGVNPPTPSWGSMIAEGSRTIFSYPHQVLFPALALSILVFAFNFLGDGLRDALDPRMRGVE
jgi:oligopeptide transport system permease protein